MRSLIRAASTSEAAEHAAWCGALAGVLVTVLAIVALGSKGFVIVAAIAVVCVLRAAASRDWEDDDE